MSNSTLDFLDSKVTRLPPWFKQSLPDSKKIQGMKIFFREADLHTVCESSRCPNLGQCWGRGVATFMILGDICTRACRFCAIASGRPPPVDRDEPYNVASVVERLNLRYVVITSVARDDLDDEGSGQFARTINEIRKIMPQTKIEVLIPDLSGDEEKIKIIVDAKPEVISHNIETVSRLSDKIRPQGSYERSLNVLKTLKNRDPLIFTKSSIMVGLGETEIEILRVMKDLVDVGCDILTIGQYLAPTQLKRHLRVERFVSPEEFEAYKCLGLSLGFKYVMSGPLVRSSFIAEEGYNGCLKEERNQFFLKRMEIV